MSAYTLEIIDECGSTNTYLKDRAGELPNRYALIARRQAGGRGRLGRSFYSPEGTGLYMSVLLRPNLTPEDAALITPAAAVAVCRAIEARFGLEAGIKWVNDVYMRDRKVCGILTEVRFSPAGGIDWVVLGVGINVSPPEGGFPEELRDTAGAVLDSPCPGAELDLGRAVLEEFFRIYDALPDTSFSGEYRRRSVLTGRDVDVHRGGLIRPALVLGTDGRCALHVRYGDGSDELLSTGEVTVRVRRKA